MTNIVSGTFNYINDNIVNFGEVKYKVAEAVKESLKYSFWGAAVMGVGLSLIGYQLDVSRVLPEVIFMSSAVFCANTALHIFYGLFCRLDVHEGCKRGDIEAVKAMIKANPKIIYKKDTNGHSLMETAIIWEQKEVVELVLQKDGSLANVPHTLNYLPIHWACSNFNENIEIVRLLLAYTNDVDSPDSANLTALYHACEHSHFEYAKLLIQQGAQLEKKDSNSGETPLHRAVDASQIYTVNNLISLGADVNTQNHAGDTPLHTACSAGCKEIAKILIEHGARFDIKNKQNQTPFDLAVAHNHPTILALFNKQAAQIDLSETNDA